MPAGESTVLVGADCERAVATGRNSISIGRGAFAGAECSIAVGEGAVATKPFEVVFMGWEQVHWDELAPMPSEEQRRLLIELLKEDGDRHYNENTTGSKEKALEIIAYLIRRYSK